MLREVEPRASLFISQRPLARLVGGEFAKMTCSSWQIATSCLELPKSGYFLGQGHIRKTTTPNSKFTYEATRQHDGEQGPKKIDTYYETSFLGASYMYRFAVYEALGVGKSLSSTVRSAKRLGGKHFIAAASRLAVQRLTIVESLETMVSLPLDYHKLSKALCCRQITPRICKPSTPRDAHPDFAMLRLHLAIVFCVIKAEQYFYQATMPSL